jgi:type II restriction/modification system DNA methylase subunit YeeA
MTAQELIDKWGAGGPAYPLSERAGAQPHFMDLCSMLGVQTPGDAVNYCFEPYVSKTGSGRGFADVWKRGHFAWEYKAPGKKLDAALRQLMMYALPLENPPLLVVSDRLVIEIHTHFTGHPSECHVIRLEDLTRPEVHEKLRWLFNSPERFKPAKTNRQITEEAARTFAETADRLRAAGVPATTASHFLSQCLFCFFAEDVELLPARLFERLVGVHMTPAQMRQQLTKLFEAMRDGGMFGVDPVLRFNGGLFQTIDIPDLTPDDVKALREASSMDWSAIDPSIFGTLFERGLDPSKRAQLGAHYTDPATIWRIVKPVVQDPLETRWKANARTIEALLSKRDTLRESAKTIRDTTKYSRVRTQANDCQREAQALFNSFLEKLRGFRILDPACGSGNFLYLALKALKDLEHKINLEAEALGLQRQQDVTGPHNVLGIEINEYASELARITIWIGELQWRAQHGYSFNTNPVLEPLDCIETRDAIVNADGTEATWPAASVVVGNPPFLGTKKMRREAGNEYTDRLRTAYSGKVVGFADLVCYWFEKARAKIAAGELGAAGLVATDSLRGGLNRKVLDGIVETATIYEAWSSLPWVNEGASLQVCLVAFANKAFTVQPYLDGVAVTKINSDLTSGEDLTTAQVLPENQGAAFYTTVKAGAFDIAGHLARRWLALPNPHGRSNADVVKPWANGKGVIERPKDMWIIDFGTDMSEADASLYEAPFKYVVDNVRPEREKNSRPSYRKHWWLLAEPIPAMRVALSGLPRYLAVLGTAKHRIFTWMHSSVLPDHALIAFARCDDTTFGILQSRMHVLWSLRLGTALDDRPRYTPTTSFDTYPFPDGLTPACTSTKKVMETTVGALVPAGLAPTAVEKAAPIADAAKRLYELREAWLNPSEWTERIPDIIPLGMSTSPYPPRISARAGHEAEVAKRTLTKLYNDMPPWLRSAHEQLDGAVAQAYGWSDYTPAMTDSEVRTRLLKLNLSRVGTPA